MVDEFLVDTNVLSEPRRPAPSTRVRSFFTAHSREQLFVSVISLAEVRYGILMDRNPIRAAAMRDWLADDVRPSFAGRLLLITEDIMLRWRVLVDEGKIRGRVYTQPDLLLAATALEHDLTLVTRNVRDFVGTGVRVLNPWEWAG